MQASQNVVNERLSTVEAGTDGRGRVSPNGVAVPDGQAPAGSSVQPGGLTHIADRWVTFTSHWLTVSVRESVDVVKARVAAHFLGAGLADDPDSAFDLAGFPVRFYGALHQGANGITIASEYHNQEHNHCLVNIPGAALEALGGGAVHAVAAFLGDLLEADVAFKVTRIDLAFDGVPFTVQDCIGAGSPGVVNLRSPVKRGAAHLPMGVPVEGEDGATFEWGSRHSDRRLRVYDRRGPVRLEFEVRRDRADVLARDLVARPVESWAARTIQHLRDFIDFVQRDSDSNISRAPLLGWWSSFVNGAERVRLKIERTVSPLVERVKNHAKRVRRSMAKAFQAFGPAWIGHHVLTMGNVVLTPKDRREVEQLREIARTDPDAVGLYESLRTAAAKAVETVPAFLQYRLALG